MGWFIVIAYMVIAAATVTAFALGKENYLGGLNETDPEEFIGPVGWGIAWPLGWIVYGPMILFAYIEGRQEREEEKKKEQRIEEKTAEIRARKEVEWRQVNEKRAEFLAKTRPEITQSPEEERW